MHLLFEAKGLVLALLAGLLLLLLTTKIKPAWLFGSTVLICYLLDLIALPAIMAHFTNISLLTLVLLLLVSTAMEKTKLIAWVSKQFNHGEHRSIIAKLGISTALLSSFTNNTAVVASLIGAVKQNRQHAPSRLLLPLSYAAIFGGTLTLIGTSTNMIVNSFVVDAGLPPLSFFQFSLVGLAGFAAGMLVLLVLSPLLPHNHEQHEEEEQPYFLEASLTKNSPLIGQTVTQSQLRGLKQLYLAEIKRNEQLICPVSPDERLQADDKLIFCGDPNSVAILQEMPGLSLYGQQQLVGQHLVEVIISASSKLQAKTLKESEFRKNYNAVVVAIRRGNESLSGSMGRVKLRAGDTLILAPGSGFWQQSQLSRDFVIVDGLDASTRLEKNRSLGVIIGFVTVIALSLFGIVPLIKGLLVLLFLLLCCGALHLKELKQRMPWDIWLVVGSALTLAHLMTSSGIAKDIGELLLASFKDYGVLSAFVATYIATLILTELITNNAAAALAFPIAYSLSLSFGVDPLPFIMAVIFGASTSFISPYGYQTNLMVFNAGRYQFKDYLKMGLPTTVVYSSTVLMVIPQLFPF